MAPRRGDAGGSASPLSLRDESLLVEVLRQAAIKTESLTSSTMSSSVDSEESEGAIPPLANGLDGYGNPDLSLFKTETERQLASLTPVRNVDWRGGKAKDCNGPSQRRAAQVQRVGMAAPLGGSCCACGSGFGPFSTCVVLVHGGRPHYSGACANCSFNGNGKSCSFRSKEDILPEWIRSILAAQNPDHPALRQPNEVAAAKGKRRASEASSSAVGDEPARESKKPRPRTRSSVLKDNDAKGKESAPAMVTTAADEFHKLPLVDAPVGPYSNAWYGSPLDDPRFRGKQVEWDVAREALELLPVTVARATADYHALYAFLRDAGQLPERLQAEEEEDENPFYGKYA